MPRSFRVAGILAGLALLGVEGTLVVLAVYFPHVSPIYRETFITHERKCWLPEALAQNAAAGLRRDSIAPSELSGAQACYMLMRGWNHDAAWGVWTSKNWAAIDVPAPDGGSAVVLTMQAVSAGKIEKTRVFVNGKFFKREFLAPGRLETLVIPVGAAGDVLIDFYRFGRSKQDGIGLLAVDWR